MPGIGLEVKATRSFAPLAWLRQASCCRPADKNLDLPAILAAVWRPDGMGPKQVRDWPVLLDLATFAWLLRAAGYGDSDADQ
jgi:hypothetical protein